MSRDTLDEVAAARLHAYSQRYDSPAHSAVQIATLETGGLAAYAPQAHGNDNSESYLPTVANIDELSRSSVTLGSQQQPSFMRRPYRYHRRSGKTELAPEHKTSPHGQDLRFNGYHWEMHGPHPHYIFDPNFAARPEYVTSRPDYFASRSEYAVHQSSNGYANLYQDSYVLPPELYSPNNGIPFLAGAMSPPLDRSPLIAASPKLTIQEPNKSHGSPLASFLPSPNSTCPSPVVDNGKFKENRAETQHPSRVSKTPKRPPIKQAKRKDAKRHPRRVDLNAEERQAFEGIFARQVDLMCRAVCTEFNEGHETQVGVDLVLQLLQEADLDCFSSS